MDLTIWPYRNLAYHLSELHRSLLTWRQWAGPSPAWPHSAILRVLPKPLSGELVWRTRHFGYRLVPGGTVSNFRLPESGPDFDPLALTRDLAALNTRVVDLTQDLQESQLDLNLA